MEVIRSELEKVQNNMQKKGWKRSGMSRMTCSLSGMTSAALAEAVVCVESPLIPWETGVMTRDGVAVSACNRITLKIMTFVRDFSDFAFCK